MPVAKKVNYTLVADLTDREARDLDEFLECSHNCSDILIQLLKERSKHVGRLYRGIKFRKRDLKVGYHYKHWSELSSWTVKEEASLWFACEDYIPDGLIDDVLEEWGHDYNVTDNSIWQKAYDEFVAVVLVVDDGFGFVVNDHLLHNQFSKEEEVIVKDGEWEFTSIIEKKNDEGKIYYEVCLSKITEMVA